MSDFIIGASVGAACWIAGNVIWGFIEARKKDKHNRIRGELVSRDCRTPSTDGAIRANGAQTAITLHSAINGRIIEIANYRSNPNGPDWTYEHFIVADGEPIEPAISTILLMKGIK
jgi:hypothetical protein